MECSTLLTFITQVKIFTDDEITWNFHLWIPNRLLAG